MSEWFPGKSPSYDDLAPTLAEAVADEAALRRRNPIPREPSPEGVVDLVAALERAQATAQRLHREAYR